MKRLVLILAVVACTGGDGSFYGLEAGGTPVTLSEAQIAAVQRPIIADLKDPESARFTGIAAARSPSGAIAVCGYVNAKNSFGGYVGAKPFVGTLVGQAFTVKSLDGAFVVEECRRAGVAF